MVLCIAIMGERPLTGARGSAHWGWWATYSSANPIALANDPAATDPRVDAVLVLSPVSGAASAQVAAATLASVRPDVRVRVDVLPVSVGVLVRCVELIGSHLTSSNAAHASVLVTLNSATWGAWLPSVAKLEHPNPTLRQHVTSWVARGLGFIAVRGEPGWVSKLPVEQVDSTHRLGRVTPDEHGVQYTCHSFGELAEGTIGTLFAMGLDSRPTRHEPFGDAQSIWGSAGATEFVITPASLSSGQQLAGIEPSGQCASCGEPVWATHCPFCRAATTHTPETLDVGAST